MKLEILRAYLLKKKGASENFPFGPEVMVFKVGGKNTHMELEYLDKDFMHN